MCVHEGFARDPRFIETRLPRSTTLQAGAASEGAAIPAQGLSSRSLRLDQLEYGSITMPRSPITFGFDTAASRSNHAA